jgi:hypothetical protein
MPNWSPLRYPREMKPVQWLKWWKRIRIKFRLIACSHFFAIVCSKNAKNLIALIEKRS